MEKIKLPCEIVADILPSYVDGLTSEVTNAAVEEHLETCAGCKNMLRFMKEKVGFESDQDLEEEKKEIDFLKKTRKKNRIRLVLSILTVVLLAFIYTIYAAFNGSFIHKMKFTKAARAYVEETYPNENFLVDNAVYDFKMNSYYCRVSKPESKDTHFNVYADSDNGCYDSYENDVLSLENTKLRLNMELENLADELFADFPVKTRLLMMSFSDFDEACLEPDMALDLKNLPGSTEFTLWIPADEEVPSYEELEKRLPKIRDYVISKGISPDYYSVTLEYPYVEENGELRPISYDSYVSVYELPAAVIDVPSALHEFVMEQKAKTEKELSDLSQGKDGKEEAIEEEAAEERKN